MQIQIDFDTFPSSLFNITSGSRASIQKAKDMRAAVQAAADDWSNYLQDVFPGIPTGTTINVMDPKKDGTTFADVPVNTPISGIRIYVASSSQYNGIAQALAAQSIQSNNVPFDQEYIDAGIKGINNQPYAGSISYGQSANFNPYIYNYTPEPQGQFSAYRVTLHEIGHILGFSRFVPAFTRYIDNLFGFNGVNANTLIASDQTHLSNFPSPLLIPDPLNPGNSLADPIMATQASPIGLTQIDLQVLADIGYEVKKPAGTLASTTSLFTKDSITGVYSLTVNPAWNASSSPKYNGIIAGNVGNDSITGNAENEFIAGGPGNDTIAGGVGNDSLYGGEGNDRLLGDAGNDYVYGGLGNDSLFSGGGVNVLIGAGQDANGKYGFNEIDLLGRSAFSLKTTFVIGSPDKGNFYKDNDFNDYAIIQGYMPGQDFINVSSFNSTTALLINSDTYISDVSTNHLIAKVSLTSPNQISYKFNYY